VFVEVDDDIELDLELLSCCEVYLSHSILSPGSQKAQRKLGKSDIANCFQVLSSKQWTFFDGAFMKRLIPLFVFAALIGGCASSTPDGGSYAGGGMTPNGVPVDATYPGAGAGIGIGIGRWGGRSGAGVGLGVGF
jgi:hypothetical protein